VLGWDLVDYDPFVYIYCEHGFLATGDDDSVCLRGETDAAEVDHLGVSNVPLSETPAGHHMHTLGRYGYDALFMEKELPDGAIRCGMGSDGGVSLELWAVEGGDPALYAGGELKNSNIRLVS